MSSPIANRYDFVLLFDVADGNPNGDPDAGNMPRTDAETGHGLITDVCLKRKIRNYVELAKGEEETFDIYVKEKAVLTRQQGRAYKALEGTDGENDATAARAWMCQNFFDVRTFGAVMSLKEFNCGQVRGPVQLTFARSIDPVVPLEHSITRMAVATEAEAEKQGGDNRTMGRKFTIPYGLYLAHGFVSAPLAERTGFSEGDLALLWEALTNMFDHDRSAARGQMATRGLIRFKHEGRMGNAPADGLFRRVQVRRKDGVDVPRSFDDYVVTVDRDDLPAGVNLIPADGIL